MLFNFLREVYKRKPFLMEANRTIEREALGRIASIGDLYDARTDHFNGFNIFKSMIPEDAINSTDNPFMDIDYTMSDSLEEKFKKMDISGEISVSILGGLVEGNRFGKLLV